MISADQIELPIRDEFLDRVNRNRFGSPIEEEFYRVIRKYLSPEITFDNQYGIKTAKGNFIIDFVISGHNRKIAFECDGKEFHNLERDDRRDKAILETGAIHSIIRLRGTDIVFRLADALFVIAKWDPHLFSQRGIDNISQLASKTARSTSITHYYANFNYPAEFDEETGEYADGFGQLYLVRKFPNVWRHKP